MTTAAGLDNCQAKYGKFKFPQNDIYIGRSLAVYGQFCESEVSLFRQILRANDTVIDAGANIGAFTVPFSKIVGEKGMVYAFEPQPFLCSILSANLLANGCINTRAMSVALGDKLDKVMVPNFNYAGKNNFGGISFAKERTRVEKTGALGIAQMRLDDVIDVPYLRLIKADVEGMELALINGAKQTIETHNPYLYLECDKPEATDALIAVLDQFEYQYYWHVSPLYDPANWKGHAVDIFGNATCVNLLCTPKGADVKNFKSANGSASHPRSLAAAI